VVRSFFLTIVTFYLQGNVVSPPSDSYFAIDLPENSQVGGSTPSGSATTAIAGRVVGGVLGLALLGLLSVLLYRRRRSTNQRLLGPVPETPDINSSVAGGAGGVGGTNAGGTITQPNMSQSLPPDTAPPSSSQGYGGRGGPGTYTDTSAWDSGVGCDTPAELDEYV
jgi:hypothetical protein